MRSASTRNSCAPSTRSRQSTPTLFAALPAGGVAVINADDEYADVWRAAARTAGATTLEFALAHRADVTGRYTPRAGGGELALFTPQGDATVTLAVPGLHNVRQRACRRGSGARGRGRVAGGRAGPRGVSRRCRAASSCKRGRNGVRPDRRQLQRQSRFGAGRDRRARRGERNAAPRAGRHGRGGCAGAGIPSRDRRLCARAASRSGCSRAGDAGRATPMAAFGAGALRTSHPSMRWRRASAACRAHAGVTVLVKGSRFMRMERVVAALAGDAAAGAH